jgi:hypothetical protein
MIRCEYCNTQLKDDEIICICGMYVKQNISQQPNIKINKLPSVIEKATNFTKSVINYVANGMENVSNSVKEERMSICRACPFFNQTDPKNPTCNKCGCYLEVKTGWASEKCPEGKWHDIKTASGGGCGCNKS